MSRAKDYFRIRFAALMAVGTFLASIGYVISGKRAVQRGESVSRMNLEWQQKNRDEVQAKKREMEKQQWDGKSPRPVGTSWNQSAVIWHLDFFVQW